MLFDYAYDDEKDVKPVTNNAPVINFFGSSNPTLEEKTIDVEHKEVDDED